MKLRNTSVYPTAAVKVLVDLVLRSEQHKVRYLKLVNVTNCTTSPYRALCNGKRILVRIGAPDKFSAPIYNKYRKSAPAYVIRDWKEAFVALFAHEAEHARHFDADRGVDEIACEHAAVRVLKVLRDQRQLVDTWIKAVIEQERPDPHEQQKAVGRSRKRSSKKSAKKI